MRSTPHIPLATHEVDLENIIKKGKYSQEGFLAVVPGTTIYFPDSTFKTPVVVSSAPLLSSVEISRNLNLEYFPMEYSSFSPKLKEESLESFEVLASPDVLRWFILESLEDFPTPGSPSPPSLKIVVTK
jgi:hypothetical protein